MTELPADRIRITGLRLLCTIGVNPWERMVRQRVVIDLELRGAFSDAAASDDIADTIDYGTIAKLVTAQVEGSAFRLIESLAESVAQACLSQQRVERVDVTVRKPDALRQADAVSVSIARVRKAAT